MFFWHGEPWGIMWDHFHEPQIDLWLTKMVPYDSPCQKVWGVTPKLSLRTKVIISLLEEVLGLLQPLHPVLDLWIELRLLKINPNDSPYPKNGPP